MPDSTGMNVTALCFCAFSGICTFAMALTALMRFAGGFAAAGGAYLVASVLFGALLAYSVKCIRRGELAPLARWSYPLIVGGFIYGFTVLFFLDGGRLGGVPVFFILAIAATPFFLHITEAIVMVALEY